MVAGASAYVNTAATAAALCLRVRFAIVEALTPRVADPTRHPRPQT